MTWNRTVQAARDTARRETIIAAVHRDTTREKMVLDAALAEIADERLRAKIAERALDLELAAVEATVTAVDDGARNARRRGGRR